MNEAIHELEKTRLLDMKQVCRLLGCHRRSVERMLREGRFPPPLRLSRRMLRWQDTEVIAFLRRLSAEAKRKQVERT